MHIVSDSLRNSVGVRWFDIYMSWIGEATSAADAVAKGVSARAEGASDVAAAVGGSQSAGNWVRTRSVASMPNLDADQQRVVAHRDGPLLVLAGPGTGKTTTIVESVVARLTGPAPLQPEQIAVLTFGRAAAAELRGRIGARLDAGQVPTVATFHSFAWALLRQFQEPDLTPQRLLSGPEQDLMIRQLLAEPDESWAALWPEGTRDVLTTRHLLRLPACAWLGIRRCPCRRC